MKLKEAHPSKLYDRTERACAKLARIARADTVFGGAKALVIADRLDRMGSRVPAQAVVGDVYAASNYSCGEWGAYACPECGTAYLGPDKAYACCDPDNPDKEEN